MKNNLSKKIGIIGGGQLGKMMILAAKQMGFETVILDPTEHCPAHSISDAHIIAGFDDKNAIADLCKICDVVTYEFEHINADALIELENGHGALIYPSPSSLKIIQNKLDQKKILKENGIPVPEFSEIKIIEDIAETGSKFGYPFLLKSATGGYDGKGNFVIHNESDIEKGFKELGSGKIPLMAEKFVDFSMEASVLACRGADGETVIFPVGRNTHVDNILEETLVPAPLRDDTISAAMEIAYKVMNVFRGVGIFCVEIFAEKNGNVLVNEVAPRPHNSGHYTIEACVTSQFEQHIRAVSGLPLGDASLIRPAAMRNLLGEDNYDGPAIVQGAESALDIPGAKLHIYGKTHTKPKRKMGHITVTADTAEEAAWLCAEAKAHIKIVS